MIFFVWKNENLKYKIYLPRLILNSKTRIQMLIHFSQINNKKSSLDLLF